MRHQGPQPSFELLLGKLVGRGNKRGFLHQPKRPGEVKPRPLMGLELDVGETGERPCPNRGRVYCGRVYRPPARPWPPCGRRWRRGNAGHRTTRVRQVSAPTCCSQLYPQLVHGSCDGNPSPRTLRSADSNAMRYMSSSRCPQPRRAKTAALGKSRVRQTRVWLPDLVLGGLAGGPGGWLVDPGGCRAPPWRVAERARTARRAGGRVQG